MTNKIMTNKIPNKTKFHVLTNFIKALFCITLVTITNNQLVAMEHKIETSQNWFNLNSIAKEIFNKKTSKNLNNSTYSCSKFSNTGIFIIIQYEDKTTEIIDLKKGKAIGCPFIKDPNYCEFSQNDKFILKKSLYESTLDIINPKTGQKSCDTIYNVYGSSCGFGQNEKFLYVTYIENKPAEIFNIENNTIAYKFSHVTHNSDFDNNKKFLFVKLSHDDELAELINMNEARRICEIFQNVYYHIFSNKNRYLFVCKRDRTAKLIDMQTEKTIATFEHVESCKLSNNDQFIFIEHNDQNKTSELINIETGKVVYNTSGKIFFPEFSPNDNYLFIKRPNDTVELTNTQNSKTIILKNIKHGQSPDCVFSHKDKFLFIVYKDETGELINLGKLFNLNLEPGIKIGETFHKVNNCGFSPNDRFLFVNEYQYLNDKVKVIDTETGAQIGKTFETVNRCYFIANNAHKANAPAHINFKDGNPLDRFLVIKYCLDNATVKEIFDVKNNRSIIKNDKNTKYLETEKNLILHQDQNNNFAVFKLPEESKEVDLFRDNLLKKRDFATKENMKNPAGTKNGFCDLAINTKDSF